MQYDQLKECDPDDISDLLPKIQRSFGFRFAKGELEGVRTFGELCDVIVAKMRQEESEDCTTQQSFYKLREAIDRVSGEERSGISPITRLEDVFPRDNRRKLVLKVQRDMGIRLGILGPGTWMMRILTLSIVGSLVEICIHWKYGVAALGTSVIAIYLAQATGKKFEVETVGEVAHKMTREHYLKSRRNPQTVNPAEIEATVRALFCEKLNLEPCTVTRDSTF